MAHSKSARKRIRQDLKKSIRSKARISTIITFEKKLNVAIKDKKKEEATDILKLCFSAIDKASKKGTIKKNTASRKKSRLNILLNKSFS